MMRLLPCVQDANWPGWQGWQVALWVGLLKEYRETLVREELGAHEAALAQAGGHSDWAADQALRLQQCSYFAGVCCPSTAPALAGLESFPSIMAGTAEWWGAPGFPLPLSPRRSLQSPLLLLLPLPPAAGQGGFQLWPLQITPTPHQSTIPSLTLSNGASGSPSVFSCHSPGLLWCSLVTFLQTTVL